MAHLELPFYYSRDGKNDVVVTTPDYADDGIEFAGGGLLRCWTEASYRKVTAADPKFFDVVIHWRKWFEPMYAKGALNLLLSQDHTYSDEWLFNVTNATCEGKLHSVLTFAGWHDRQIIDETQGHCQTISGLTLGVDTDIYTPSALKDPRTLLWASDPGRGLSGAVQLAIKLWQRDRRFKLKVTYPDYVKQPWRSEHPAIEIHSQVRNSSALWDMFNTAGIIPYTSEFMEPSSRVHRQGQAAGCMVLYPPDRGSPSNLIQDGVTGFVRSIDTWADLIIESVENGIYEQICKNARDFAVSENWAVQAKRFNETIGALL